MSLYADEVARQIVDVVHTGIVEDVHYWTHLPGQPIEQSSETAPALHQRGRAQGDP